MLTANIQKTKTKSLPAVHYVMWQAGPGGAEISVFHYINQFGASRKLHAFSLRPIENSIFDGAKIDLQTGAWKNLECYAKYYRYCKEHKKSIFHLLNAGPIILLITLWAGVKKPIYHIHGTIYWKSSAQRVYLKIAWWLISLFKVNVIANSKYSAHLFNEKASSKKTKLIYNGFDTQEFLKKRSLRKSLRRLAYIGRLNVGKNVEIVIRLFEEIAGNHPELELWIAGDGHLRSVLEQQASESPYADRIKFLGYITDISSFYQQVDLFLFLSAYESFGNVLAEALLTGLPILTSDIEVFNEIHGGEKAFLLGNPENYEDLKQNFLKAVADFPALAQKAYAISEYVNKKFNIQKHLSQIESIYEQY